MAVFEWSGAVFTPLFFMVAMVPSPGHPCAQGVNFRDGRRQASAPGLSCSALLGQRCQGRKSGLGDTGMWLLFLKQTCISSVTLAFAEP